MTPDQESEDLVKKLEMASQYVQQLITGKGKGIVYVLYEENGKAVTSFTVVRNDPYRAMGLMEASKLKLMKTIMQGGLT